MGGLFSTQSPLALEKQILTIMDHYKHLGGTFGYSRNGHAFLNIVTQKSTYHVELDSMKETDIHKIPCIVLNDDIILGHFKNMNSALDFLDIVIQNEDKS